MNKHLDAGPVFKEHYATLKTISLDDSRKERNYMLPSEMVAVNFDAVKNAYIKEMSLTEAPSSSDALLEPIDGEYCFIEFKNGHVNGKEAYGIRKKIYDSLLIFNDIMNVTVSFCRENMDFILVYNEQRNSDIREDEVVESCESSPSGIVISNYFSKKAKQPFIRFGLEKFKTIYFRNVFTYTPNEFEKEYLTRSENV